ncbi:MAG: hypothetical protein WBL72_12835, partial [Thermoguttaceae bacterium]
VFSPRALWYNSGCGDRVHRQAARRALRELGLLTVTMRSISPPLSGEKRDKILRGLQVLWPYSQSDFRAFDKAWWNRNA